MTISDYLKKAEALLKMTEGTPSKEVLASALSEAYRTGYVRGLEFGESMTDTALDHIREERHDQGRE